LIQNKEIRKRRRTSSECLGQLIDTTIVKSPMPILTPATQIKIVVDDLRAVIDELDRNFASAKSLILKLARLLDETKQGKQSQICTKIKEMLADKVKEGKISKKWIERCLPQEYRRRYVKSEQSSLSGKAKKLEKIIIVDNKGKTVAGKEEEPSPYNSSTIDNNSAFTQAQGRDAIQPIQKEQDEDAIEDDGDEDWTRSQESEQEVEEAPCSLLIRENGHLLESAEIKFTIPKDRYEEVKTAMSNGSNCCYLIFDRNSGSFLRSESSEIGN
jgi:uncharacterized protein YnzC (UPF0291/DUF896 family)